MHFALNHSLRPHWRFARFAGFARDLGIAHVELRNDLPGVELADGTPPHILRQQAAEAGVAIATINALQRFDDWNETRAVEATALACAAQAVGAAALVLCPVNDRADGRSESERAAGLRRALAALAPVLADHGVIGMVEPLGFSQSALRTKRAALAAIDSVDGSGNFRLVHDTFHHVLAGETEFFPARTGLVHVSGIDEPGLSLAAVTDAHRVLVGPDDRLESLAQVRALLRGGYRGLVSLEPFAENVTGAEDVTSALQHSLTLLRTRPG